MNYFHIIIRVSEMKTTFLERKLVLGFSRSTPSPKWDRVFRSAWEQVMKSSIMRHLRFGTHAAEKKMCMRRFFSDSKFNKKLSFQKKFSWNCRVVREMFCLFIVQRELLWRQTTEFQMLVVKQEKRSKEQFGRTLCNFLCNHITISLKHSQMLRNTAHDQAS